MRTPSLKFIYLEISLRTIKNFSPIIVDTVRNHSLKIWKIFSTTKCNVQRKFWIELVASVGGAQAVAKPDFIVTALDCDNDADFFTSPIANILKNNIIGRISHHRYYVFVLLK